MSEQTRRGDGEKLSAQREDGVDRRGFLQLVGASFALAGLADCRSQPDEPILPFVHEPNTVAPTEARYYATTLSLSGEGSGVLVRSHLGRPVKIEGNPAHPANRGASSLFDQAALLDLYEPSRAKLIRRKGAVTTWARFLDNLAPVRSSAGLNQGAKLRLLSGNIGSPIVLGQIADLHRQYPALRWHQHEPVVDHRPAGAGLAFGQDVCTTYDFSAADVIVSIAADFLGRGPKNVRDAQDFGQRRRPGSRGLNQLFVAEATPTLTGAMADYRQAVAPSQLEPTLASLYQRIQSGQPSLDAWVEQAALALLAHRSAGLVVVGWELSPEAHALAHHLNGALGNVGTTLIYRQPRSQAAPRGNLSELVADMLADQVDALFIIDSNPVYSSPVDLPFATALAHVPFTVAHTAFDDETAVRCQWHIPVSHPLEIWGDAMAYDGTASLLQPLISRLYDSRSEAELFSALLGEQNESSESLVRRYWQQRHPTDFPSFWSESLRRGIIDGSALPVIQPKLQNAPSVATTPVSSGLELAFVPDATIYDGRFAHNGWLQEIPKSVTSIVWDNYLGVSDATAKRLGVSHGTMVKLSYRDHSLEGPVALIPDHADNTVSVYLGYGRERGAGAATGLGYSAYRVRYSDALSFAHGASIEILPRQYALAAVQTNFDMQGRAPVQAYTVANIPTVAAADKTTSLYAEHPRGEYAWGMAIDLSSCIGCNVCTLACQAENNIPVVGKDLVLAGRQMHWIRVDHYYDGADTYFQPVPCMHCETAPCEVVCPVGATTHDHEGLNQMVYNRCVGTRYCSNNCPYKVRRFNFFAYGDRDSDSLKLGRNPEVSIRPRGVMEKCTYCIQRINAARYRAELEDRPIRDQEIVTACAQACPTEAIVFGNINDPQSAVSQWKAGARNYALLAELNTKPRTTYLGKIVNRGGA